MLARRSPFAVQISDVNFGNLTGAFILAELLSSCPCAGAVHGRL
jgi:hypothetical protein